MRQSPACPTRSIPTTSPCACGCSTGHQLCPGCAAINHAKRNTRTDLRGRRALLTGGRTKIGMCIALRLLRDGAHTTITTRSPRDAVRRFATMPDASHWLDRLRVIGIDLRDPAQVVGLADDVAAQGALDILINNAAQTVRRSTGAYSALAAAESDPLPIGADVDLVSFGKPTDAHPATLTAGLARTLETAVAELALVAGSASPQRISQRIAIDAGGLIPDIAHTNSWVQNVGEIDETELRDPHDGRRHRLDHRRTAAPHQGAPRRGGLPRPARSGRRRGAGVRPDRGR